MLIFTASVAIYPQVSGPKAAVIAFYKYDRAHSQVFNRRNIEARRSWFSDELYRLLLAELEREASYIKENPDDKPYFGDGLPFQPIDEPCRQGRIVMHRKPTIGEIESDGNSAKVKVLFAYPRICVGSDDVEYTLKLVWSNKRWLIDNVVYSEDADLVKDLNRAEY